MLRFQAASLSFDRLLTRLVFDDLAVCVVVEDIRSEVGKYLTVKFYR